MEYNFLGNYEAHNIIFKIVNIKSSKKLDLNSNECFRLMDSIIMTTDTKYYPILKKLRKTISPFYFSQIIGEFGAGILLLITNIKKNKDKITIYGSRNFTTTGEGNGNKIEILDL